MAQTSKKPYFESRPWGWFLKLIHTKRFWIKFIWAPGRTSSQKHTDRDEWHFGLYKVKRGEIHRLSHGAFIEVAVGRPREDDIIRIEDDYGREKK